MLSLGDSNSPLSLTGAEAEACSTAAWVLIMLTTAPFGVSFAIGCWRASTSCTVPRIAVLQPDKARRAIRASALVIVMLSPLNGPSRVSACSKYLCCKVCRVFHCADANAAMSLKDDAATGKSAVLSCLEPRQDHPEQQQRQNEPG